MKAFSGRFTRSSTSDSSSTPRCSLFLVEYATLAALSAKSTLQATSIATTAYLEDDNCDTILPYVDFFVFQRSAVTDRETATELATKVDGCWLPKAAETCPKSTRSTRRQWHPRSFLLSQFVGFLSFVRGDNLVESSCRSLGQRVASAALIQSQ